MQPHLAMFFAMLWRFSFPHLLQTIVVFSFGTNELASKKHCKNDFEFNSINEVLFKVHVT